MTRKEMLQKTGLAAAGIGAAAIGLGKSVQAVHAPYQEYSPPGGNARVFRDGYGVPYIYGETDDDLFYALGYTHGEDRLFQYHTFRMAGKGRLSELLGADSLNTDIGLRLYFTHTDHVLVKQFDQLSPKLQGAMTAWLAGINAYISEANSDPAKMPIEFFKYGFPQVQLEQYTLSDMMGFASYLVVSNGVGMNNQFDCLRYFGELKDTYPEEKALALFNDTIWPDDPEAETSVPSRQGKAIRKQLEAMPNLPDLSNMEMIAPISNDEMEANLLNAGASVKLGSMGMAIHQSRSGDHRPLFGGGFQLGYTPLPALTSEAQLTGGESGYNLRGAFAGPVILSGRREHFNFTAMVGFGANNDWYQEELAPGGPTGLQYEFNDQLLPFEPVGLDPQNQDVILVWNDGGVFQYSADFGQSWHQCVVSPPLNAAIPAKPAYAPLPSYWLFKALGSTPTVFPLLKSVHGPLMDPAGYTLKRVNYGTEYTMTQAFFDMGLAETFDEFRSAVRSNGANMHFIYTGFRYLEDGKGTDPIIAYFFSGEFPIRRKPGVPLADPRFYWGYPTLPRDGRGNDEWLGTTYPHIESINPSTGFLVNWNCKPTADFPYGCRSQAWWSKGHRVHRLSNEVLERIEASGKLTVGGETTHDGDIENILKEISSNYDGNHASFYLMPYLLRAAENLGGHPVHTDYPAELETLRDWNMNAFDPPAWTQDDLDDLMEQSRNLLLQYMQLQQVHGGGLEDFFDMGQMPPQPITPPLCADTTCQDPSGWAAAYAAWGAWLQSYGALQGQWQAKWGAELPGHVIYTRWMDKMDQVLFSDIQPFQSVFPGLFTDPTVKYARVLHVLDHAKTGYSGVPPNLDYFDGADPEEFMLDRLKDALDELNGDYYVARRMKELGTNIGPIGFVGEAEWITFSNVISYRTGIAKNRLAMGQSGFIEFKDFAYPVIDPNMYSQMLLTINFGFKPIPFKLETEW